VIYELHYFTSDNTTADTHLKIRDGLNTVNIFLQKHSDKVSRVSLIRVDTSLTDIYVYDIRNFVTNTKER